MLTVNLQIENVLAVPCVCLNVKSLRNRAIKKLKYLTQLGIKSTMGESTHIRKLEVVIC